MRDVGLHVRQHWADASLALNTVLWGATFVLVKAALREVSPVLFLALRFSLAAVALALLFRRHLMPRPPTLGPRPLFSPLFLPGLFLFTGFFFQVQGLRLTTAPK